MARIAFRVSAGVVQRGLQKQRLGVNNDGASAVRNQLKYAILPSFEKIRKIGDGLWEATFVPYEQAHTIMKSTPLTKTEQKYGVNILKHLLPEKTGGLVTNSTKGLDMCIQ